VPDYLIRTTIPGDTPATRERIVSAKTKAQAIAHVVADTLTIEVATTSDAMRIAAAGGALEVVA
jgi:hypothetical protein